MEQIQDLILNLRSFMPRVLSMSSNPSVVSKVDRICINTDFSKDTLYIGYESQMQNTVRFLSGMTLFLIEDMQGFGLPDNRANCVIIFPSETDADALFESCNQLIKTQRLLFEDAYVLFDAFLSQSGLNEIIEHTARLVGNPVMVIDKSYKVLAYSKDITTDDFQWNDNISRQYCSYEYISMFSDIDDIKNSRKINEPFFSGCIVSHHRHCISRLCADKECVGYLLSIEACEPFSDRSVSLLQVAARLIARIISIDKMGDALNSDYASLLLDCLSGKLTDKTILEDRMRVTGMKPSGEYYILVIDIGHYYQNPFGLQAGRLRDHISSIFKNVISVSYNNDAVVLVQSAMTQKQMMEKLGSNRKFFEENKLRIGVSDQFSNLISLQTAWGQAKRTLKLAAKLEPSACVVFYDDYKIYDLMLNGLKRNTIDSYIGRQCAEIIEYDARNDTQYFETLYYYILFEKNLEETANKLFIHRNTVSYRIRRAKELFDIELDDPKMLLMFSCSYLLQRLKKVGWFDE
jgi:hypothetical protein